MWVENGQTDEARAEFAAVLELDANNQEARAGLNRVNGTTVLDKATKKQIQDLSGWRSLILMKDKWRMPSHS